MTNDTPRADRRKPRGRLVASVAGVLLLVAAAALAGGAVLYPEQTEAVVGGVKVRIQGVVADAAEIVGETPTITLGHVGDRYALDTADFGVFVEMESYRVEGVPPVYAAHNNRGGDVILSWNMGEEVRVLDSAGNAQLYVVAEERFTPKWSQVSRLEGMSGDIVVQTCFYGEDRMRFLSLTPR